MAGIWSLVKEQYETFTSNLGINLFCTSAAIHAIILIASPLLAVHNWRKRRSSDSDTSIPYLVGIVGTLLWWRYSLLVGDLKLAALNTYALLMQFIYISSMWYFRSKKRQLTKALLTIAVGFASLFVYVEILTLESSIVLIGRLCTTVQVSTAMSCLYMIRKAILSRRVDFIPFAPVALTLVVEFHAIIYSLLRRDIYMIIANGTFFCLDGSLFMMFFIFPSPKIKAIQSSANIGPDSPINELPDILHNYRHKAPYLFDSSV